MAQKTKSKSDDKELIELGKKLRDFFELGYANKKQALWFSFLKGAATGFGAFLGGTILIALLLWTLSFFENVPLLSNFVESLKSSFDK